MDKDVNKTNPNSYVYCSNCGTRNRVTNGTCSNCNSPLIIIDSNTQNTNKDVKKEEENKEGLQVILGIAILVISVFIPFGGFIAIVVGCISVISKEYRTLGKTILIGSLVLLITAVVLFLLILGACMFAFG